MNLANGGRVSSWMSECPFRLADYDSTDSTEIVYVLFFFSYHINAVENLYVASN